MYVRAEEGTVEIKVEENFAAADMEPLVEALKSSVPFSEVIVDFSGAYDFPDSSFPSFIRDIKETSGDGACVSLRGLSSHQSRLLRYLGLLRS